MNPPRSDGAGWHGRRLAPLAAALLLFVATVATFQGARHGGFLPYDDDVYVTEHPFVAQGWTWEGARAAFTRSFAANWHPLTWLSHMLDVELFGLEHPGGHHLTSVFLHALNAVLLLGFLLASTGRLAPAFFAAALFALHPLRAESVAWVAERKDVLAGTLFLLTLVAYLRHARAPSAARLALAWLAYVLGLLAKPTLVTLPFVLLLLDRWPLERMDSGTDAADGTAPRRACPARSWRFLLAEKAVFLAPALVLAWITLRVQASDRSVSSLAALPLLARIANALRSCAAYLGDTFVPRDLATFYPHPALLDPSAPAFEGRAVIALVLVGGLLVAGFLAWKRAPWISVGILWFLGTLVPVIGLVQAGEQARADRYTYLPSIGIALALAFGLARLARARAARLALGLAGVLALAGLGIASERQVRTWRDGVELFQHAARVVPRNYLAWSHLGVALAQEGRPEEAQRAFETALEIQPRYAEAENNLGQLFLTGGDPERARTHFERALELEPDLAQAEGNLGAALAALGRDREALVAFRRAVEGDPHEPAAWWNLGLQLLRLEEREEALSALRRARQLAPFDLEIARELQRLEGRP